MSETSECRPDRGPDRSAEPTLDLDHLNRMTLGDQDLEREVLQLFERQSALLAERLSGASASVAASCAHSLKGAARGIGAWRLARAAEQVECLIAAGEPQTHVVIGQLLAAVDEVRTVIAQRLRCD